MDLKEWTTFYVKHKDILTKKIQSIEQQPDGLLVKFSDKEHHYFIQPTLEESILSKIKTPPFKTIVCLISNENTNFVVSHWKDLAAQQNLFIIFANPETNAKVILNPYVHNSICDQSSLKAGLKAMFENM